MLNTGRVLVGDGPSRLKEEVMGPPARELDVEEVCRVRREREGEIRGGRGGGRGCGESSIRRCG